MQKRENLGVSAPSGSPRRSLKARGAGLAATVLAFSVISTLPAKAASVCAEIGKTAIITTVGEPVRIQVGQGADAGKILTNGVACGTRNTNNTDKIRWIVAGVTNEQLIVDLTGGALEPGDGVEGGTPEIEFEIDLGGGSNDTVEVLGSSANDHIVAGRNGTRTQLNFNAAEVTDDADMDNILGVETITIDGGEGDDVISGAGSEGTGTPSLLATDLTGGTGNDTVSGGAMVDTLDGGPGRDTLSGGASNDTLTGDVGSDVLEGGAGGDVLNGGADQDLVSYVNSLSSVSVNLADGTGFGNDASGDVISSVEDVAGSPQADLLVGDGGNNMLSSGAGSDFVYGGAGDDSLLGRAGSDDLSGGDGNDTLSPGAGIGTSDAIDGGSGKDTVNYGLAVNGVTVDLSIVGNGSTNSTGNQNTVGNGSDDLVGLESIRGTFVNDTLRGNGADNFIFGWGGDDTIMGRAGNDALAAGDGTDTIRGEDGDDQMEGGNGTDDCDGGAGQNQMWNCP